MSETQIEISKKRKLRAILFADIVGYTSLMQQDEGHASILLQKFGNTLNEQVANHEGEVNNNYGDGCLCTFESAVDAVRCAKKLQFIFQKEPQVPVRIGLHSGDVFFEYDNVFGDSVNIASRIESIGVAGSILFSKQIKRHISNQKEFEVQSLGEFELKNVVDGIEVFAMVNEGITVPKETELKGKIQSKNSTIAVLPFRDMSPQKDQEYFGDGIAEEILNTLANLKELKVAGRTSSFSFKGKEVTIAEIGKVLNVNHVLEGSVRKHGNKVRITAQLIKVEDGFHVWSEKYDRDFDDIFAIQDELAQSIGEVLLEKLAPEQIEKLKTNLPRNSQAYDLFLRGKHLHWKVYRAGGKHQKDFDKSELLFLEAIEFDATYALAHAGLADLYDTHIGTMRTNKDTLGEKKYMALSKQSSDLAFRLNPELSYVNTVRGCVQIAQKEYRGAFKSFLKGIQLSPNNPESIYGLQYFYRVLGFYFDAIQIGNQLKEIDPLFEAGLTETLSSNYHVGNDEQVIRDGQYIIDLKMDNTDVMRYMFYNYFAANRIEEARAIIEKVNKIDTTYNTKLPSELTYALVKENNEYIKTALAEGTHFEKFIIHNFYGDLEKAEKELKIVLEEDFVNSNSEATIQNSKYLYFSKNKLFSNYQKKDWFQKIIAIRLEAYDFAKKQFPRVEEVIEQFKN